MIELSVPAWVQLATSIGAGGVLAAWLWFERQRCGLEREERLALQKANDALRDAFTERTLRALHESETAIKEATASQEALRLIIEGLRGILMAQHAEKSK